MNNKIRLNDMHTKFYLCYLSLIIFISFFLTTFVKADEYSDLRKIGFQKEKIDNIYLELMSANDAIFLVEDIITKLEENTINKKEAMTQGMQLIKDAKQIIEEATKKLNNLEPLVLSTLEMKDMENVYTEVQVFLKNKVEPTIKEIVLSSEEVFYNALKGNFDLPAIRWAETLRKTVILVEGENEFLKISIASLDENHPKVGIIQSTIESNNFAVSLVSTLMFIIKNPEASDKDLLEYFSKLEIALAENIKKSESSLSKTQLDILNMEAEIEKVEASDAEKDIFYKMIKIFEESLAIEQELLRGMKKNAKTYTYKNFIESDDLLSQLLNGFDEMSYYATLREEVEIKSAQLLQGIKN